MGTKERIRALRKNHLKMTLDTFGERLGVGKTTISAIETGKNNVTEQMIKSICREFDVSEDWLRNGEGEVFVQRTRNEMVAEFVGKALADKPESARNWVISMLSEFSDDWWEEVNEVLKKIREKEIGPYADDEKRG